MIEMARKLIQKCEADLRAVVAAAADRGDYHAVVRITGWAKQLADMTIDVPSAPLLNIRAVDAGSKQASAGRREYPLFSRRGDLIVKTGWSKRDNAEYEHKASRRTVFLLARAVAEASSEGRVFQIASLLPLIDSNEESEIPKYQIYLIIAWWRDVGLLDQHGRRGYSVPKPKQFVRSVETAWAALPEE